MQIWLTRDVGAFAERARLYLAARIERNVLATVTAVLLTEGALAHGGEPWFALGLEAATGEVAAAALRTPPRAMLAVGFDDPEAARALVDAFLAIDPDPPGVNGGPRAARAIASAWATATGGTSVLARRIALHELHELTPPADPPPGGLRPAGPDDLELLARWYGDFSVEAHGIAAVDAHRSAWRAIAFGRAHVWDDGGQRATVGHSSAVAGVCRIGPVYTPPEHRGRGYAGAAVAELSRRLLGREAERCILNTDLANPISNRIYAALGYRRCGDWEEHAFLSDSGV
ncbi:MAG: GNAT family N-acetyltransferase [Solirubrobacteraceae bacterium]